MILNWKIIIIIIIVVVVVVVVVVYKNLIDFIKKIWWTIRVRVRTRCVFFSVIFILLNYH